MTYHFSGTDDLLREAFTRFADRAIERFTLQMGRASTPREAVEVIADSIIQDALDEDVTNHVVTYELYTLAARNPAFREITERWITRSRAAMEEHFDPRTARLLDALIEGLAVHQALDRDRADLADMIEGIHRITGFRPFGAGTRVVQTDRFCTTDPPTRCALSRERLRNTASLLWPRA